MKNRSFLLMIALFQMYNFFAQNPVCLPNAIYKDSIAGIYPRPYNDSTKLGGIDRAACIDEEFEYPLTVIIPDMVTVPVGGIPIPLGLESASLDVKNAVTGLPKGLNYFCNPNTCIMLKNKPGCVVIKGTVTAENKIGVYDLVINLKLVTALGTFDVTYPGALFPGKYFITVAQKGSKSCLTSDIQASRGFEGSLSSFPNPSTTDLINIKIGAYKSGTSILTITDVSGRLISKTKHQLNQGENSIMIPTMQFSNGTYFYTIDQGGLGLTKRFVVLRK